LESVSKIRRRFHRFCPERVVHVGLRNYGADHGVEGAIHPFSSAIAFRSARRGSLILDAKGREKWRELTLVFSTSVDMQFLDFEASLEFNCCKIFFELFRNSGGGPVLDAVRVGPSCSLIDEEKVVDQLLLDGFGERSADIGLNSFKFVLCF
jgi:hypothetical protein